MVMEETHSSVCETITQGVDDVIGIIQPSTLSVVAPRRRRSVQKPPRSMQMTSSKSKEKDLLFYEDIPEVLQFNKYVRSGYRAGLTNWECVKSVFSVHNESANIWSHLLPLLIWGGLALSGLWKPWEVAPGIFYLIVSCTCCCLLGSALYHTFIGCQCNYHNWLVLDVCGIYVATLGFQWAIFYIGFACYPVLGAGFITIYYFVGALGILYALKAKTPKQRGMPLLYLSLLRFIALFTRPILGGASMKAFWLYLCGELLSVLGGTINVVRIPERYFQHGQLRKRAKFDLLGSSHQIMHVCVLATMMLAKVGLGIDVAYFQSPTAMCMI